MRFLSALALIAAGTGIGMRSPVLMGVAFAGAWAVMKGFDRRKEDDFVAVLATVAAIGAAVMVIANLIR